MGEPRPAQAGSRLRLETLLEMENWPMIRTVVVAGALLAGVGFVGVGAVMAQQDVAVQQQNLMKTQGKSMYGVLLKTVKGEIPYDQAAINTAITELEASLPKIPTVFTPNPKEDVANATYGASQKIWQNKADFDAKVPPVSKTIADVKGSIKDPASLKVAFDAIQEKCTGCHETFRVKLK
jgi:cytochrome c556